MVVLDINRNDLYISTKFKDIFRISDSIDKYLENNFPYYFISYQYKNNICNFHKDFRGYKKTLRSLINDITFNENSLSRFDVAMGYHTTMKIEIDEYYITISGKMYLDKNNTEGAYECKIGICKEKWTDDGRQYIGADYIKIK
jgi:hypothetical protein